MSLPSHLIWLDLETTGLDPIKPVIEVAAFLAVFGRPFDLLTVPVFHRVLRFREWQNVELEVIRLHTKSSIIGETLVADVSRGEVDLELEEAFKPFKLEKFVLAGSSVHFDLAFCRIHFPKFAAMLSHRVYDVSALKLFCHSMGMPYEESKYVAHRAQDDVFASVEIAKRCDEWLKHRAVKLHASSTYGRMRKR